MPKQPRGPWSDAGDLAELGGSTDDHPFALDEGRRYLRGAPLGEGGMGVVHRAVDGRLLREVAIKRPAGGPGSAVARRRLTQEAWVTAQLDHPGIVSVHDAGIDDDGNPWYAMRLIEGDTLEELLDDEVLGKRLELLRHLRDACEAVGYAHRRGFVHRDIKPANIMVGLFGETQVMDWGLARPAPGPSGEAWRTSMPEVVMAQTEVGMVVGTPAYLSPEQVEGNEATPSSDVWSLGVVLHELLAGARAFSGPSARDIFAQVRQARLPELTVPEELGPLVSVLRRATAAEGNDRFADAKEMADELTRFLEGGRVVTHRYSNRELLQETVRVWRTPLALAGLVLVSASLAVGLALRDARQEADRAARAEEQALGAQALADANLRQALVAQAATASQTGDRGRAETLAAHALLLGEDARARGILLDGRPRPRYLGATAAPECGEQDMDPRGRWLACQGAGELALWDLASGEQLWTRDVVTASRPVVDAQGWVASTSRISQQVLVDSHGRLIASADEAGTPVWMPESRELAVVHQGLSAGPAGALERVFSCTRGFGNAHATAPGQILGVCFGEAFVYDGELYTFPVPPETESRGFPLVATASESMLVWATEKGHVLAHALPSGELLWERDLEVGAVHSMALSPDGSRLALLGTHLGVHELDAATGVTRWVLPELPGQRAVAIDPEGQIALLAEELHRWALPAYTGDWPVGGGVTAVDFSTDGDTLAVAHGNTASLLDWPSRSWSALGGEFSGTIKSLDFSAEGRLLLALPTVTLLFSSPTAAPTKVGPGARRVGFLGLNRLLTASYGTAGPNLDTLDGTLIDSIARPDAPTSDLETAPDGHHGVWAAFDGIWEVEAEDLYTRLVLPLSDANVAARSDALLLGASRDALVVQPREGEGGWRIDGFTHLVLEARISPDSRLVFTGHADGSAHVYSAADGALLADLRGHVEQVPALAVHPDGTTLITASWDRTVRAWDLRQLERDADALVDEVYAAWGLTLEDALR